MNLKNMMIQGGNMDNLKFDFVVFLFFSFLISSRNQKPNSFFSDQLILSAE